MSYADNDVLGAKNLLPNNATSQTKNGITFTVNTDRSITVNGTATRDTELNLTDIISNTFEGMILNGSPSYSSSNLSILVSYYQGTTWKGEQFSYNGANSTIIGSTQYPTYTHVKFAIYVKNGEVISNKTFYPMIRLATDSDDTYVPYAMTNKQLTDVIPRNVSSSNKLVVENYLLEDTSESDPVTILTNNIGSFRRGTYNVTVKTSRWSYGITLFMWLGTYWSAIVQSYGSDTLTEKVVCNNGTVTRQKLITESDFKSYGIKTIWTGSKTKGDTGLNFDASPYDLCFALVGGTWCRLITGVGGGSTTRKKFSALYAGRDYVNGGTYEQYYLLDIVPDGTIATCGWFDIASKDTQNARLAGQKALELAIAGTSTWTDPTWKQLKDVESNVSVSKIVGIKFQTKS
jgi:hypothetical protein